MTERDTYFVGLQEALGEAGIHHPALVLDRDRLDANLSRLRAMVPQQTQIRVVAKSVPVPALIERARDQLGSSRLMTFGAVMARQLSDRYPDDDQLLGKPLPVRAAAGFLHDVSPKAASRVQWLVDTTERLGQYEQLGRQLGARLRVNLELDVGLHRGGMSPGEDLRSALVRLRDSDHVEFSGLMGYEAHLARVPHIGGLRKRAVASAKAAFADAVDQATDILGAEVVQASTLNVAGSATFWLHGGGGPENEIAVGSALVMPKDFAFPELAAFPPALFVATPALKVLTGVRVPGLESAPAGGLAVRLNQLRRGLDRNSVFIHGGRWLAQPVDPPGLRSEQLMASSNQQLLTGPTGSLRPDDLVFFRPDQSEALMFQFGDIVVVSEGVVVDRWETLPVSA